MSTVLTSERLKSLVSYDEASGDFLWNRKRGGAKASRHAGHVSKQTGYRLIGIDGYLYLAHRLAWLYMHGEFPGQSIDHIDRNRDNNAKNNLRLATQAQNAANSKARSTSKSGVKGVSWCSDTNRWRATITHDGRQKSLGRYVDMDSAISAYQAEAIRLHSSFAFTDLEKH